jgi:hypothetical protein
VSLLIFSGAAKTTIGEWYNDAIGDQDVKKTTTVLVLAISAVTIGISVAPQAGADPSFCQQVGATTVCGQGGVNSGGPPQAPPPIAGPPGGGCTNAYGGYQNCNEH